MCELTILFYGQCGCGSRDGSHAEGFIVTKNWYNRLFLDSGAVPFRHCTQAKNHTLSISRSNTVEFPRCHRVQIKTIRFEERPCFRCFADGELKRQAEMMKQIYAKHKSLTARFNASTREEVKDAEFTKTVRQTIRMETQSFGRIEKQQHFETKADLQSITSKSSEGAEPDWEDGLRKRLAYRELAKEKNVERKLQQASGKFKEQEEKNRQSRLALLRNRLAQANQHSQVPEEHKEPECGGLLLSQKLQRPLLVKKTEPNPQLQEKPSQTVRVVRTPATRHSGLSPAVQGMHETSTAEHVSAPATSGVTSFSSGQPQKKTSKVTTASKYHTISVATAGNINVWVRKPVNHAATPLIVESAPNQHIPFTAAEAPEFRPFQRPPPTEPRMMRAPTAPRAMRENSLQQATWQAPPRATYRGYGSYRG